LTSIGWEQSLSTQKVKKQRERMKWKKVNHLKAKISKNNQSQWKRTAKKKRFLKMPIFYISNGDFTISNVVITLH